MVGDLAELVGGLRSDERSAVRDEHSDQGGRGGAGELPPLDNMGVTVA